MLNHSLKNLFGNLVIALLIIGCGESDESSNGLFKSAADQVAPVFKSSSISGTALKAGSNQVRAVSQDSISSPILNKIYQAMRDYEFPRDEGVIDMHNIYKVLTHSDQIYDTAKSSCATITETEVASPFNLGLNSATYDCAGTEGVMSDAYARGFAIREVENTSHVLLTYRGAPDPTNQEGHGIVQGNYNRESGDLNLRMVHLTTYPSEEGFVVRSHIEGNAKTHAFSLSSISSGLYADSSWTALVGSGISKGEGNYFLFKAKTETTDDGAYFCIKAEAKLADLQAMAEENPLGKSTVDPECAHLKETVDALVFIEQAEVPTELSDFSNSSILLNY